MKLLSKIAWYAWSKQERYQWLEMLPALQRSQFERLMKGAGCEFPPRFHDLKCIFVHIPKTAGTSIADCLFGRPRPGHQPLTWYETIEPELSRRYFKFAFVRNPWDRLVSAFHYLEAKDSKNQSSQEWSDFIRGFDSFDDFVTQWVNEENIERQKTFVPQYRFVLNKFGMPGLDFVGRFETLREDYQVIRERLGVEVELPHSNRTAREDFRAYYTPETRDIVARVYARDIAMFNYQFD